MKYTLAWQKNNINFINSRINQSIIMYIFTLYRIFRRNHINFFYKHCILKNYFNYVLINLISVFCIFRNIF